MSINSNISDDGKTLVISIEGRFDVSCHKSFSDAYTDKLTSVSTVVMDLANLEYIDSSGLGMMLMLKEKAAAEKADIQIINPSAGVMKIFKTTNYDKLFNIIE